jgi:hypothetical protein
MIESSSALPSAARWARVAALPFVVAAALSGCGAGDDASTNGSASAAVPAVAVHANDRGAAVHATVLGVNSTVAFDPSLPGQDAAYRAAGMRAGRWPGGSEADEFNWQTTTGCRAKSYVWKNASFERYMTAIAKPAHLDVELTVNYGTANQPACIQPGDPAVAAAWVHDANAVHHYGVKWWEVGNEVYGPWETDQHALPHDAATYATVFGRFSRAMKSADRSINVGVPVSPGATDPSGKNWDAYVLGHAKFDYVDWHYYAQRPGKESDAYLTQTAPRDFATLLGKIKTELAIAGKPNAPIDVGEIGSVYDQPGKQTASITQALFAGQVIGEMIDAGVQRAEWWIGNGGCGMKGNMSADLYGWQDFGGYAIFSDDLPTPTYGGCSGSIATIPLGTLLPTARIYQLFATSGFATDGEHAIGVTTPAGSLVRAYAATHGNGLVLALFNLDPDQSTDVPVTIDGLKAGATFTSMTYGKSEYDTSRDGTWSGPTRHGRAPWPFVQSVHLPPYSVTIETIAR